MLMLGSYALMLLLALLAHDERMLLVRDPATSALAGLLFLATCTRDTSALACLSRRLHRAAGAGMAWAPAALRFETAVWGAAPTAEAVAWFGLLDALPLQAVPGVLTAVELGVTALLLPWTIRGRRRAAAVL
ncbi:hypothetical protein [Streptomyces carpinensis]|uniref:Uncharacterized protein n=1 Tax=Streptomyces carpinensis TaxID=66369 RepID=A0ABV1WHF1_9ACTN|nr:hypothetical protein [Streptomyces carpinensis]